MDHLWVLSCGAYVYILQIARHNKLSPKSELMIYLGVAPGGLGNTFMHLPNNSVFTAAHAEFDKLLFPKCRNKARQRQALTEPVTQTQPPYNLPRLDRDNDIPFCQLPRPPLHRQNNDQNDTVDDNRQMHQSTNSYSLLPSIREETAPHQGDVMNHLSED